MLQYYSFDEWGNVLGKRGYVPKTTQYSTYNVSEIVNVELLSDGTQIVAGCFCKDYTDTINENISYVMKLDAAGNLQKYQTIETHDLDQLYVDSNDGIYLLGKTAAAFDFTDNKENAVLLKLNASLETEWARAYYAESFEYKRTTLNLLPDGNLVLAYSTEGAFPVILAKLNASGEILWEKGYPLYEPEIDVLSDGSLLMGTFFHFDESGNIYPKFIISKTDPDGNIANCETFPTCLETTHIPVSFGEMEVEEMAIGDLDSMELIREPFSIPFSPFCDIPPPPSPDFAFPDTLCVGDCAATTDTYNYYAHGIEWELTGPGTDSLLTDSLNFAGCFSEAGTYQLRQTIWFLGCDYTYEKTITVLGDLTAEISPAGLLCGSPPAELSVSGSRPLRSYWWDDSTTAATHVVWSGGTYAVRVSDGYCEAGDTADIEFWSEKYPSGVLDLPSDTTVCEANLPYVLEPKSAYASVFELGGVSGGSFELWRPGSYVVSVELSGCRYESAFHFSTEACPLRLYVPNIFSPNGDGINDTFFAQGPDYRILQLTVYDRWGGVVYESRSPTPAWDGSGASAGVYTYKISVENTL
ncbi:MAG: gliding motility-associated C-terminal domain-containing protein, partial [Bacteroidetes bacterium]